MDRIEQLFEEGEYQQAHALCLPLAEAGSARAQVHLGMLYFCGVLGSCNDAEAARWFRAASDQGEYSGSLNLGTLFLSQPSVGAFELKQANYWYDLAARQGCPFVPCLPGASGSQGIGADREEGGERSCT
ncbi:MAG: sel1 repeat family protein, partial [Armatimonadetes bacterium]|nr:sel1 repeat family protein [Armatimonadota bacterium]